MQYLIPAIKVARPVHWVKNFALFAALIFTGQLLNQAAFITVFWAFLAFNFATSTTYIFNDILDVEHDRLHPIKKNRPIAHGDLSIPMAIFEAGILALVAWALADSLSLVFSFLVLGYILLQVVYSLFLKNIAVIDILIIASGFILRVYAGAFVINAHLSVWFLLCVVSVALFLASGKRRAELKVVDDPTQTRKSLGRYPKDLLNSYVTMFGNAAWMSWALFTFFESPRASLKAWLFLAEFSKAATVNKLLMATVPLAIFCIMRYQSLIFAGKSEAPEKILLTDIPLVSSVIIWTLLVVWILYSGVSVAGI